MPFKSLASLSNPLPGNSVPVSSPSWATQTQPIGSSQPASTGDEVESGFAQAKQSKASAAGFVVLNLLRVLSVVGLLMLFAGQLVGMVTDIKAYKAHMSSAPNASLASRPSSSAHPATYDEECDYVEYSSVPEQPGGVVWAELSRVFILLTILFLLPTELSLPRRLSALYTTHLPAFSSTSSLTALGVAQIWMSVVVLSKFCGEKVELVSGWWGIVVGVANLVVVSGSAGLCMGSSAKHRRLVFSWENAAQLTPQSKVAYKAYETYNEKLRPYIASASNPSAPQNLFHSNTFKSSRSISASSVTSSEATIVGAEVNSSPKSHKQQQTSESTEDLLPAPKPARNLSSTTSMGGVAGAHRAESSYSATARYTEPDLATSGSQRTGGSGLVNPGRSFGGFGFGKMGEKDAADRGFVVKKPVDSLPRYISHISQDSR